MVNLNWWSNHTTFSLFHLPSKLWNILAFCLLLWSLSKPFTFWHICAYDVLILKSVMLLSVVVKVSYSVSYSDYLNTYCRKLILDLITKKNLWKSWHITKNVYRIVLAYVQQEFLCGLLSWRRISILVTRAASEINIVCVIKSKAKLSTFSSKFDLKELVHTDLSLILYLPHDPSLA